MSQSPDHEKIRRWREERHWSQEHLADVAGIGSRTIQRIESGGAASPETMMALAAAFGVDVGSLTRDPARQQQLEDRKRARDGLAALRLSVMVHVASYAFSMIVFLAIGISVGDTAAMMIPAIWWTVGVAAHALVYVITWIAAEADRG